MMFSTKGINANNNAVQFHPPLSPQSKDSMLPYQQRLFLNHVSKKKQLMKQRPSQMNLPAEV